MLQQNGFKYRFQDLSCNYLKSQAASNCWGSLFIMRKLFFLIGCFVVLQTQAQELYVYTEPASNMAARSIGFRLTNKLMQQQNSERYRYMLAPELMVGVSKKIMLHAEGYLSNMEGDFKLQGGSVYGKYRFLSKDDVHSHFRMAAYARGSINNMYIHQPAIDLQGMNSGWESGLVATGLKKRTALSASASFLHAADNSNGRKFIYGDDNRQALGYTLSVGRLFLPKEYTSYEQTNVNLMLELLGQTNFNTGRSFVDLAPSVQFIIHSKMRVDLGYRFALVDELSRSSEAGFLLRFEYNIFNAL